MRWIILWFYLKIKKLIYIYIIIIYINESQIKKKLNLCFYLIKVLSTKFRSKSFSKINVYHSLQIENNIQLLLFHVPDEPIVKMMHVYKMLLHPSATAITISVFLSVYLVNTLSAIQSWKQPPCVWYNLSSIHFNYHLSVYDSIIIHFVCLVGHFWNI